MTWAKIDDQLAFHPKAVQAGNEALGMWVRAMSYSCQMLTGGFIAKDMAVAFGGVKVAQRLVDARLWHEVDGGYQFHDWDEYQPCAETEKAKREQTKAARSQAGKAGAKARWNGKDKPEPMANDMANGMAKPMAKPMANAWQNDAPEPEPEPEGLYLGLSHIPPDGGKQGKKTKLNPDWQPDETLRAWTRTLAPALDIDFERGKFVDWFHQTGKAYGDWNATWRNWVRRAVENNPALKNPPPPPKRQFGAGDENV